MIAIYPGSFDPLTLGHIDIATRGAALASKLIVAVLYNPNKKPFFDIHQRLDFLTQALGHLPNVQVDRFTGLLADYAHMQNAHGILRGLRNASDFESEAAYAANNKILSSLKGNLDSNPNGSLNKGVETIFIPANPALSFISSTIVREISTLASPQALCTMVPPVVQQALQQRHAAQSR